MPCIDVAAYGHVAIIVDALLYALPQLQVGVAALGGDAVAGGKLTAGSDFFTRTESVTAGGGPV